MSVKLLVIVFFTTKLESQPLSYSYTIGI